ncbi:hypothetical protein HRR83_003683 [Exophiala dermatitidis]|uniref:Homeobox and C2H2 transcription factor n=2 Tax=Exophiala dermatitidis TaxID=5970 RepID=H6BT82_EXODN|nr:uncharacterized protein HMPREF1120_01670 [Exophiala dermatitidis NIH/UT8656]KAJ4519009.1 hypothetical protein HRR75_002687 [Exophiala dermatitidis]EHY53478.1 hypothetical protein HMPREF1120_01670 [Exophiala dermatitidis NIH/UT8656]KAJ4522351.1 hypothetical protein HRR74_002936 [Exophiala dermatitidis]KAJ4529676.1 hypothetical protein HRR73_000704 [Exophiala dermatitidis]KAJ4543161.1 hypothetical protein HRR77_005416 [Exophiala dermatitidis]
MEYFNFEDASHAITALDLDDCSSLMGEANEADATDCYESLFFDKSNPLPAQQPSSSAPKIVKLKLINNVEIEAIPHTTDGTNDFVPMFRAKESCELCARMGLDCFLATRGSLVAGCTCCISLYRECSFVHPKIPKGFVSTFPGITEDQQVCEGSLSERRKAMKSMEEGRGRKTGARFPRDAVKILKQWLAEHADHPYPNEREKDELKQVTGLKRSQISNWLANARRRGKVRPASGPSSPMLGAIDIPPRPDNPDIADLNPLDRWKASPPEHEPASMTAIARAVTSTPLPQRNSSQSSLHGSRASSKQASSEDDSSFSMFRAPSVSSFGTRESSNSDLTFASSRSNRSKGSFASSQDRRRRRRAPMTQRAVTQQSKSKSARIFQCTFCTDSFPAKYDWQRHEKSLHLALERWTCCPNGGTMIDALTGVEICAFCREANPTADHLETHNFTACQEKTVQERTFYRKDHLSQHLKLMHNAKLQSHMDTWKSTTNEIKSSCGFCPSKFTTWQQRADHLAAHFRNGADMSMWSNGWGFEPYVERLVENALPPYLIGHERMTMEPYVARAQATPSSNTDAGLTNGTSAADGSEPEQIVKDSNCWGRLEQELTKYVSQQRAAGKIPTDSELQDRARIIIFEDNDPWNWTVADNKQWLDTFKYQRGLTDAPEATSVPSLAEVPVMAPYVIPGGLKSKSPSACPGGKGTPRPSSLRSLSSPDSHPYGVTGVGPHSGSALTSATAANFDPQMDFDFDSIDFSGLDLGIMDDMDFDVGLHGHLENPVGSTGMHASSTTAVAPNTTVPFSTSVPGHAIFGSYTFGSTMGQGTDIPVQQPYAQQQPAQPQEFMTTQELNNLAGTGYMGTTGFH